MHDHHPHFVRDNAGLKIHARGKKVIIPPNLSRLRCVCSVPSFGGYATNDVQRRLGMNDSLKEAIWSGIT